MKVTKSFLLFLALLPMLAFGQVQLPIANGPTQASMVQAKSAAIWTDIDESLIPISGTRYITPTAYRTVKLNQTRLNSTLIKAPMEFTSAANHITTTLVLPMPDGSMETFRIIESPIMEQPLQDLFPEIKTYSGVSTTNPGISARFDFTPQGFHAMILIAGESTVFIDPYSFGGGDKEHYIVYKRNDFASSVLKEFDCSVNPTGTTSTSSQTEKTAFSTCELRVYRLALSATGEYTTFHGGTVALAAAAQVTTMNRVNGVYERDLAVRMNIVGNNNLIIYTNSGTDPFTNGTPGTMITQNQTNTNTVIGNANYDIGHVFGTNSGGLAGLGVVCITNQKARGVTGSGAPIGDPFDIDYVAHEMGHQFGANHTQNNGCNRNNGTAMEPGSASTIMGYAGICAPNVQNNSDDHFHGVSLQEMGNHLNSTSCPVTTALSNSAPTITGTNGNVNVPASTPFSLTAIATDPDPNVLTYNWEQMNNQVSTQPPVSTSTGGPNFRSYSSSTNPTRYFPNLVDLSAGNPTTWEVLSSVTRTMNFRVTVRDNAPGGSCADYTDVTVNVDGNSGPFIVTYPSATGITWNGATSQTVTWDVANTTASPVSCSNVDILLSIDGGINYSMVLSNTANDGTQTITVPNTPSTTCRIMVRSAGGTFFDISNNNFTIVGATFDYTLTSANTSVSVCPPGNAVYTLDIGSIGGYSDPVNLSIAGVPAGGTSSFSVNPVTPVGTSVLTISNTGSIAPGVYTMTVNSTSTSGPKSLSLSLTLNAAVASSVSQIAPVNGATGVSANANLTWTTAPEIGVTYEIDIATDAGFVTIVDQATGLTSATYASALLSSNTTYYWRVRAVTACGSAAWSSTFSFTTSSCSTLTSTNVPVTISATGTPTVTSTLTSALTGTIQDVNVTQLTGTHTWINDLTVTLTSPTGTIVTLFDQICTSQDNFDVQFDDAATPGALPCPPVGGGVYQPNTVLSAFNGETPNGTWSLSITDNANQDGGTLTGWAIEICTAALTPVTGTDTQTACDSYLWIDGNTYTTSNSVATHTIVGGASNGADSIVTLNLTMNYASSSTDTQTSCGPYTWIDGNSYATSNTTATHTIPNAAGCDSVITLNLTVNNPTASTDVQTSCGPITWIDGNSYSSSNNSATHTIPNAAGCDSVITLNLTVNSPTSSTQNVTACVNYTWSANGTTYTSSGNYTATLTNAGGCDSTATLNLTIATFSAGTDVQTTCGPITWIDGNTYSSSNNSATYTYVGGSVNGCDSVVTLDLTVNSPTSGSESAAACGSYTWATNGTTYTASGAYTATLTNAAGCDSTATLNLTINTATAGSETAAACGSYTWATNNMTYTATGSYTDVLTNAAGCDSTVTLDLTIYANPTVTLDSIGTFCDDAADFSLSGGTPSGGTYSGTGVSGGMFSASTAGVGVHTVSYSYTNSDGCTGVGTMDVIVEDCSSIDELSGTTFTVYPNPVQEQFVIASNASTEAKFNLYDATGRIVLAGMLSGETTLVSLVQLAPGTYTLEIEGFESRTSVLKL